MKWRQRIPTNCGKYRVQFHIDIEPKTMSAVVKTEKIAKPSEQSYMCVIYR